MNDVTGSSAAALRMEQSTSSAPSAYVWYVIGLLTVVNVFSYMDRMALSVLAPAIKAELSLSDGQLGLLTGLAFSLCYAMCGIPIARWADRGSRRDIIAIALVVWSVMTALSGGARSFWHLFAARVGIGAGESGCSPAAGSLICDYVPLQRRSGAFALHSFGNFVGAMLGMALAGLLSEVIGWRWTFVALGVPGIALAVVVRCTLREPMRGALDGTADRGRDLPLVEALTSLWRCKTYRLLVLSCMLYAAVVYGMNQWWPSFYVRVFGLRISFVGPVLGIAIGIGSGAGILLGGYLANQAARRDLRYPLMIGAGASLVAIPTALGALFTRSSTTSLVLVALSAMFLTVSHGPIMANMNSVVASSVRATAGSINIFFGSALGFTLGPLLIGVLSDLWTPTLGSHALRYALIAPICVIPVIAVTVFAAARALPNDLRNAGTAVEESRQSVRA